MPFMSKAPKRRAAPRRPSRARPAADKHPQGYLERAVEVYRRQARVLSERVLDVTSQLESLRDRYQAMYDGAPVGYMTLDRRGVIHEMNETAAAVLGDTRERARGKPLLAFLHRSDVKLLTAHLLRAAQGNAVTEFRLRSQTNELRVVHLVSRRAPGLGPTLFNTVVTDVAGRRRSDQALRESELRYRSIVETAAEGICTLSGRGNITFVNTRLCAMLGYTAEELIGHPANDLLPASELDLVVNASLTQAVPLPPHRELQLRRRDGTTFWASVSTSTLRDEHGTLEGLLCMYTDVTPRRQLSMVRDNLVRQLVAAQETERQRIALELHDQMGQHLVALSLGLAQLRSSCHTVQGVPDVLARLQEVSEQLSRDVHHLALELRPSALDHLGLAVAIVNYAEDVAARTGIEIDLHCSEHLQRRLDPAVETSVYRIVQEALTNIVRHASARHASVIIEPRGKDLQIIVEDDGVGFNPESVSEGGARERLGLAGMRERATLVGATLQIESRVGHGTTIFLTVPLAEAAEATHEETTLTARR
jgi:PAS domain S-box-containing protein